MATTDFAFTVCSDAEKPEQAKRKKTLEEGVEQLMLTQNGGLRITGAWKAGGKRGELEFVYVRLLSPTATSTFVLRFIKESIRLKIAKELMRIKNPDVELLDGPPGNYS